MRQFLLFVFRLVVALWAVALVVAHKVLTGARQACVGWAIWHILANARAGGVEIFLEAAAADALVVVLVCTCRFLCIDAFSMLATLVALTIVNVCAPCMGGQLASAQASCGE
jgi:hypothetical protein